jgi:hypothetical protein
VSRGALSFFNSSVSGSGALRNFATLNLGNTDGETFAGDVNVAVDNEAGVLTAFGVINNDDARPFVNGPNATLRMAAGMGTNEGAIVVNGSFGDSILGSSFEQDSTTLTISEDMVLTGSVANSGTINIQTGTLGGADVTVNLTD